MFHKEEVLIPFNTSPLPEGPWMVFAPHADDETFGMGGTLLKSKAQGIETHLVVLTDGAEGGDADNLVDIRRKEVQRAAEILGFQSLQCWSEPDRFLDAHNYLVEKVVSLITEIKPKSVFFPGPLEIHPDHRAAGLLAWRAIQRISKAYKPEPIAYEIGVQNPINCLIDISSQIETKKEVMALFDSQNQENNYPELVLALDKGRTFSLPKDIKYAEGFYRYCAEDIELSFEGVTHKIIDLYQRFR